VGVAYWICDLQQRARGSSLVTAHDVLDDHIAQCTITLFRSQYWASDYGRVLVIREILYSPGVSFHIPGSLRIAYLASIARFKETCASVEDNWRLRHGDEYSEVSEVKL
jgi:hypothetical protein